MKDEETIQYFDKHVPEYDESRLESAAAFINRSPKIGASLIDIGCGVGNTLEYLKNKTGIENISGMDVSQNCLLETKARTKCNTLIGSIIDTPFIDQITEKFDYAILSAILHHLIGKSRRDSRNLATLAIANSLKLLKNGGNLIIQEPTLYPPISMDIVFYVKKLVTTFSSERIQIFDTWNNIGAPVVSYYSDKELTDMIGANHDCRIVEMKVKARKVNLLWRMALISKRADTTIVVKKGEGVT